MSKQVDDGLNRPSLWGRHQQSLGEAGSSRPATRHTQPPDTVRRRGRRGGLEQLASSFDHDLVNVDVKCDLLRGTLAQEDLIAVERAAYALASACLVAEATAMQMLAASPGIPASKRFARKALVAANSVVTALFGEALAETSKWAGRDPTQPGVRGLRSVLRQLSIRVDVREIDVGVKHCGGGLAEWACSARRASTRHRG
jgi:hypothetical protein